MKHLLVMTCVAGLVHNGKVWIGADSAGVAALDLTVRKDPKVFRNGDFLFGFTDSFRMGQILAHAFTPPKRTKRDLMEYFVVDFVNGVRKALFKGGFAEKQNEQESGGTFLVGHAGRLFLIDVDYQVGESLQGFDACGCGAPYALGSLHSTIDLGPEARVMAALIVAEKCSAGVRAPFLIESI